MAGGVNPFGFSMGVLPAPRAPRQPKDLPSAPFGFTPPPSKMQQTLAILNEYNPLPAFERLLKSPMALGGPISEQDIADGLTVAGGVTGGSAAAPKPRNALNMGASGRAKAGGETGINNYLYKGGQFLPSTEAPPGTWRIKVGGKSSNIPNGSELIEPGKFVGRPTPFSRSIFRVMGGGTIVNIDENGIASVNPNVNWDYLGSGPDEKQSITFKNLAASKERYSINDLVDLYNKGVRWIDTDPLDHVEIVDKAK